MTIEKYQGCHTAIITPFLEGEIDYESLAKLVDFQCESGIDGIVSVGTTGESPTLSKVQHIEVVKRTVEFVNSRVPVIAGTGSNSTEEAVLLTKQADEAGADAFLVVAPYYNKPNAEGLFLHFSEIAKVTTKPIILYSIPSRCGIEIGVDVVRRLHEAYPHVAMIKEAGGSCNKVSEMASSLGDDFLVLSGDDGLTLPFMSVGAKGIISVTSNAYPKELSEMVKLALAGDFKEALDVHNKYFELFNKLFIEPNPVPVKYILEKMGKITTRDVRMPLCDVSEQTRGILDDCLAKL